MSYPNQIYLKAQSVLGTRREQQFQQRQQKIDEISMKVPEIEEIQNQLSKIGLEISKIFMVKNDAQTVVNSLHQKSNALIAQRTKLLVKYGYPADILDYKYVCPACKDTGFIDGRMCNCHRQLLKDIMHNQVAKTAPLDRCTFDNFILEYYSLTPLENSIVPRTKAEIIFNACRKYATNFSLDSKNLLFMGGTGLGKTHLSLAIANTVISKGFWVCYGTSQNICDDLQSEQFGRTDNLTYKKAQVLNCDLLILDDLGTELENQYAIATLYNIINTRILSKKPTIISTNYQFAGLQKKYDQRITSRLSGEYQSLYIVGNDIRNIK